MAAGKPPHPPTGPSERGLSQVRPSTRLVGVTRRSAQLAARIGRGTLGPRAGAFPKRHGSTALPPTAPAFQSGSSPPPATNRPATCTNHTASPSPNAPAGGEGGGSVKTREHSLPGGWVPFAGRWRVVVTHSARRFEGVHSRGGVDTRGRPPSRHHLVDLPLGFHVGCGLRRGSDLKAAASIGRQAQATRTHRSSSDANRLRLAGGFRSAIWRTEPAPRS